MGSGRQVDQGSLEELAQCQPHQTATSHEHDASSETINTSCGNMALILYKTSPGTDTQAQP